MALTMRARKAWLADRDTDEAVAKRLDIPFKWYSWSIVKALEAVHALHDHWDFTLSSYDSGGTKTWLATLTSRLALTDPSKKTILGHEQYTGEADSAPLAICRAILDMPYGGTENDQEEAKTQDRGQEGNIPDQGGAAQGS